MATLDEVTAQVAAQATEIDRLAQLNDRLVQLNKDKDDALAGNQAKIDALAAAVDANQKKLEAAIAASTPTA